MKNLLKQVVLLSTMLGLGGCEQLRTFPKHIQEFPEPWQVLEPGKPVDKPPRIEIVTEGEGASIEPGDLVQVTLVTKWMPENVWKNRGDWWLWIGFKDRTTTPFFVNEPWVASALLGQHQGTVLAFIENGKPNRDKEIAGIFYLNPVGETSYYNWRKNSNGSSLSFYISGHRTPSTLEIKRVCKGQLKYRTVRLFDDSPTQICSGLNCYTTREKREVWLDEAKIEARCPDNKIATFEYGPVDSFNGKEISDPIQGYFDEWYKAAWRKLPVGVQLK